MSVEADEVERQAASDYGKAVAAALPVVEALAADAQVTKAGASRPIPAGLTSWPDPDRPPAVEHAVRRTALEVGWLVASGASEEPDPHVHGRLSGFAVAVKDLIDVAGLPVRNGTPGGLWREPETSAPAWDRLAEAGAHCAGKAATHEMAWGVTTPAIGNPHDPRRFAGGSSGGSAAVVAAGAAHAALGTDTGGSVRVPAALCGVVGLRPTHGAVPSAGVTPMAPSQDVVGPLAPDVTTCAVLLEELLHRPLAGASPAGDVWRIGVLTSVGALDEDVASAYDRALSRLHTAGVEIVEVAGAPQREAGALSVLTMLAESATLHANAVRATPEAFGSEFRGITAVGSDLLAQRSDIADLLARARHALDARSEALFAEHCLDAFLTPTTPCVAPLRDGPTVRLGDREVPVGAALSRFTAWSAASGWPAISVPVPAGPLPVGIQLMARPHREDVCLALGELIGSGSPSSDR